jgi:hypothetical protein
MQNPITTIHIPYTQYKYIQNIVVKGRKYHIGNVELHLYNGLHLITLHVINNNFLQNVVWNIILPKLLFPTKTLTSATENFFIPHAPTATLTPRCVTLPIWTMSGTLSMVLLLWLVEGLVDEALDGWEMGLTCPQERHHHPFSYCQLNLRKVQVVTLSIALL